MSYGNVPDDWGCYFTSCRCGARYHMSEGGCGCMDDLECGCGANDWDSYDEEPSCSKCGSGPHVEGRTISKVHVARKAFPQTYGSAEVRPGDRYRRSVHMGYFPNGPRTLRVTRHRIEKGPAWPVEAPQADISF